MFGVFAKKNIKIAAILLTFIQFRCTCPHCLQYQLCQLLVMSVLSVYGVLMLCDRAKDTVLHKLLAFLRTTVLCEQESHRKKEQFMSYFLLTAALWTSTYVQLCCWVVQWQGNSSDQLKLRTDICLWHHPGRADSLPSNLILCDLLLTDLVTRQVKGT